MPTEKIARTKWCPMVRTGILSGTGGVAINRHITDDDKYQYAVIREETRCIASDCMMWRWTDFPSQANIGFGYCGLAGDETIVGRS